MDWKLWLQGLAAAATGGAAGMAAQVVNNRMQYGKQAPPITGASLGVSAGLGALVSTLAYLIQSPIKASAPMTQTEVVK